MIGIPLGLLYSNAGEWLIHKYVLHALGKSKNSFWSFHWHEHHRHVRKSEDFVDPAYHESLWEWNAHTKEIASLVGAAVAHIPLFPVAPCFTATVWYSIWNYYHVHKKSHLDANWAREHLPWHYDHHKGPDQDANWCVTRPWFDILLGTRKPYVGTEQEKQDMERYQAHQERRQQQLNRHTPTDVGSEMPHATPS